MKQRQPGDATQLDIDASVHRTVHSGGFPTFRYRALTKPPEYFILVDMAAARDHYARWVDYLLAAMQAEGVFIDRYFYDKDPRLCFPDYFSERLYLQDIEGRFHDRRLIIIGDCDEFLDPVTGDLESWVSQFQTWSDRVVLTPLPPGQWGWRETALSEEFLVLPATVDGLAVLGEHLSGFSPAPGKWPGARGLTPYCGPDLTLLRSSLGEDVFQWLCACAIFPQLHYDLTLFLGGLPCMPPGLLSEDNIRSLFSLTWFRTGGIPDDKRLELIHQLDQDKSQAVRRALLEVLIKNPPPRETFARAVWSMHIVLQRWMLEPRERRRLKELSRLPYSVGPKTILDDYTALKLLESAPSSPLKIVLPSGLHKYLFHRGLPLCGFKTSVRAGCVLLAAGALYALMTWPQPMLYLTALVVLPAILYVRWETVKSIFSSLRQALRTAWPFPSAPETPVPLKQPGAAETELSGAAVSHPARAWVVVLAGAAVNLCLGILYAWSVWAKTLINLPNAGQPMTGLNTGWTYITNAQAATPFSLCVLIFTLFMIPGGWIQDKLGPKVGAITGGLFLALGCIVAGLSKSYAGLIIGFGIMGGIGMGLGYAAPLPAALKWFGPHKRGLAAGLVVGGYGAAALYIAPLAAYLVGSGGITYSFVWLGIFFAFVVTIAGSLLAWPPPGYLPPASPLGAGKRPPKDRGAAINWTASEMMKSWQFYALVIMFIGTSQSGLLIIANNAGILAQAAKGSPFLVANTWILVSFGGLANALGRVGTGLYSDKIGRANAYTLNCLVSALCLFLMPWIAASGNLSLLFLVVGVAYWQYGGGLALIPAFTADFYGTGNLGLKYGIVFIGWGMGFFMTRLAGTIKDITGSLTWAYWISATILMLSVIICRAAKRAMSDFESEGGGSITGTPPDLEAQTLTDTHKAVKVRRLTKYKVFQHPGGEIKAVKQGWSWPAFFFPYIWPFLKRIYLLGSIVLFSSVIIEYLSAHENAGDLLRPILYLLQFGITILIGKYGNSWWEQKLLDRGYKLKKTVSAVNQTDAIASYSASQRRSKK